jgi:hypothetical protein
MILRASLIFLELLAAQSKSTDLQTQHFAGARRRDFGEGEIVTSRVEWA